MSGKSCHRKVRAKGFDVKDKYPTIKTGSSLNYFILLPKGGGFSQAMFSD